MCLLNRVVGITLILLCCLFFSASFAVEKKDDKDIMKVGNIILTQLDLDIRVQRLVPMQLSFHGGMKPEKLAEIQEQAMDELITVSLKALNAIDEEISVDSEIFQKEWEKITGNTKNFTEKGQPYLWSKARADLYRQLLAERAEQVVVNDKVKVTDEEVLAYYSEKKDMYFRPKLYTASHILVKVDPSSNNEERELLRLRAEDLLDRAKSGEDFYNLAYYESDDRSKYVGGSLGSFHAGQTVVEFDEVINEMKEGEISGLVRTMYGFHIIKLDAVDEARQLQFEEVAQKIRTLLEEEKRKQLYETWMSKLIKLYPVEHLEQ